MFDRDRITNEQIGNHDFKPSFRPFITNKLGIHIVGSVNISKEDDGVELLFAGIGGVDDVGT